MRECFTYGSVRGAAGNGRPYRDPREVTNVKRAEGAPREHMSAERGIILRCAPTRSASVAGYDLEKSYPVGHAARLST